VGGSGALAGLFLFVCTRNPGGQMLLFFFPVSNRAFGAGVVGLSLAGAVAGSDGGGGLAHGAHLGGAAFGAAAALATRRAPRMF
jgi:membrane associated rhomboid family serine protease